MASRDNSIKKISSEDFFVFLIMIFVSGKTLLFSTNANMVFVMFYDLFPFFFLPILYFYIKNKRRYIFNKGFTRLKNFFIAFAGLIICSALFNFDLRGGYVVTILLYLAGFIYIGYVPVNKFLSLFEKIVWWIALLSIIVYFINIAYPAFTNIFPKITNTKDFPFANCFVTVIPLVSGSGANRLFGPFSEPGVYQIYLNLALLFHIYLTGRLELKKALVYITAIVLTQSTTGYICLGIFLLLYVLESKKNRNRYYNYIMSLVIISAVAYAFTRTTLLSLESDVFAKFTDDSVSTISRMASVTANFEIFLSHPIFGVGFTEITDLFKSKCIELYSFSEGIANTNTILFQFASLGLFYGILWCYSFYLFFRRFGITKLSKLLVIVGGFLLFSGELMTGSIMLYILLGYGLLDKGTNNNTKEIASD